MSQFPTQLPNLIPESRRVKLTGLKKAIYDLLLTSNDDAMTMSRKTETTVGYVYKVINELKKEGRLPQDFTLRHRKGNTGRTQFRIMDTPSESVSHDDKPEGPTESAEVTSFIRSERLLDPRFEKGVRKVRGLEYGAP